MRENQIVDSSFTALINAPLVLHERRGHAPRHSPLLPPRRARLRISPNHPLRRLFTELVAKELPADREVAAYVGDLMIDFVHVDHLYRIRNSDSSSSPENACSIISRHRQLMRAFREASGFR